MSYELWFFFFYRVSARSMDTRELRFSRAMVFAIEEINHSTELLPGITLGYQIHDSCASVPVAVQAAFQLVNGVEQVFDTGEKCSQSGMMTAIVGESGSTPSISMSRVIGSFDIPQVRVSNSRQDSVLNEARFWFCKPVLLKSRAVLSPHRWATMPLVRACLISISTRPSSERSRVTFSRRTLWPNWWNTLAGLGLAPSGPIRTTGITAWRLSCTQRAERESVWNIPNLSIGRTHAAGFSRWRTSSAGVYSAVSDCAVSLQCCFWLCSPCWHLFPSKKKNPLKVTGI